MVSQHVGVPWLLCRDDWPLLRFAQFGSLVADSGGDYSLLDLVEERRKRQARDEVTPDGG